MKDTRITSQTARVDFHVILEKTEPKPVTDGDSDRRAGKDRGKLRCWNTFRSLSTSANTQFDFSFGSNCVINIRSGQQIQSLKKSFKEAS